LLSRRAATSFRDNIINDPHHGLQHLHSQGHIAWEDRQQFKDDINATMAKAFKTWTTHEINTCGMADNHIAAMHHAIEMDPCPPDELPLWNFLIDDLPQAVLLFRAPFLGHSNRGPMHDHGRPACAWCAAPDSEWGYHLLTCPNAPPHVTRQRDATLNAILTDLPDPQPGPYNHPTNLERLYHLNWHGVHPHLKQRRQHRSDTGNQAHPAILRMAAWYMRTCINAYSPDSTVTGTPPRLSVPPMTVYGKSPFQHP
jgi:hypothetical protein